MNENFEIQGNNHNGGVIPPGKWDMSKTEGMITVPSTDRLMNPPPMFDDVTKGGQVPPMFDEAPVKKPIDELRERHPDLFDENGELKHSSVELIDLLFQNYEQSKKQEYRPEEPQPVVPSVF